MWDDLTAILNASCLDSFQESETFSVNGNEVNGVLSNRLTSIELNGKTVTSHVKYLFLFNIDFTPLQNHIVLHKGVTYKIREVVDDGSRCYKCRIAIVS